VLGIVLLLVSGGSLLAASAMQHDPLVQADTLSHYAYRALEAGIDTYLNTINAQPNLVNCSSVSTSAMCTNAVNGIKYNTWTPVANTGGSTGAVPEYYLWTNPQLCFSTSATTQTSCSVTGTPVGDLAHVQALIVGAAGYPGHFAYQSSVASFVPENGFLTHIWWSNYESTDPALAGDPPSACTYDWNNGYNGPGAACAEVFFGPNDKLFGPVFANDSIYVASQPNFGSASDPSPVTTHDPNCLFVDPLDGNHGSPPGCASATTDVGAYDATNSHFGVPLEPIPTGDSQLQQVAALGGCVYSGPTTISLYAKGGTQYMNVWSPETPVTGGHDADNAPTNTNVCVGTQIPAPSGGNGNGVIYVANAAGTCAGNGDNPFDDTAHGGANAQISTAYGYNYTDDITTVPADCEGDAFVRNAAPNAMPSSGATTGVAGNLTIAAANNVVITGSLTYTDCPATPTPFNSTNTGPCGYNTGASAVNDSLGLIAQNYVEVNHPGVPNCQTFWGRTSCQPTPSSIEARCTATVSDVGAAICDPGPNLVIDAAVLALSHSFAVNNYSVGSPEGTLTVYGSIDQDWRGAVGTFSGSTLVSGYSKYYTWDNRLEYVSIPSYLNPGTPSWGLASSAVVVASRCPAWPGPYPNSTTTVPGTDPSGAPC